MRRERQADAWRCYDYGAWGKGLPVMQGAAPTVGKAPVPLMELLRRRKGVFYPKCTVPCPQARSTAITFMGAANGRSRISSRWGSKKKATRACCSPRGAAIVAVLQGSSITGATNRTYHAGVIQLDESSCQVSFSAADDWSAAACF